VVQSGADFSKYDASFFESIADVGYRAGKILLSDVYAFYAFNSVCDVGCGSGSWLRAAAEAICAADKKLTGIDGEYARKIAACVGAKFLFQDLEQSIKNVDRHDLLLCLEVAEHLSPGRAESLIDDLCAISDVVFFGAAVDGQRGANHLNERPQSYWMDLFCKRGYQPFIFHRQKYWNDAAFGSCPYYISGSFLYVKETHRLSDVIGHLPRSILRAIRRRLYAGAAARS
jgi:hypothetical protein